MASRILTPDEQHYVGLALRLAAVSFRQDAATLSHDHGSFPQLVANFERAATIVEQLALLIEAADEVQMVTNDAEDQSEG